MPVLLVIILWCILLALAPTTALILLGLGVVTVAGFAALVIYALGK